MVPNLSFLACDLTRRNRRGSSLVDQRGFLPVGRIATAASVTSVPRRQSAAYGTFTEEPTRPELERFFFLDDVDRDLIALRRPTRTTRPCRPHVPPQGDLLLHRCDQDDLRVRPPGKGDGDATADDRRALQLVPFRS
jgi:hypothetical protein